MNAAKRLAARAGLNFNALDGFIPSQVDEPLTQFDFMRAVLILARVAENEPAPTGEWQPLSTMPRAVGAEFWLKRRPYLMSGDRKTEYRVRWSRTGSLVTATKKCHFVKLTRMIGWQP